LRIIFIPSFFAFAIQVSLRFVPDNERKPLFQFSVLYIPFWIANHSLQKSHTQIFRRKYFSVCVRHIFNKSGLFRLVKLIPTTGLFFILIKPGFYRQFDIFFNWISKTLIDSADLRSRTKWEKFPMCAYKYKTTWNIFKRLKLKKCS